MVKIKIKRKKQKTSCREDDMFRIAKKLYNDFHDKIADFDRFKAAYDNYMEDNISECVYASYEKYLRMLPIEKVSQIREVQAEITTYKGQKVKVASKASFIAVKVKGEPVRRLVFRDSKGRFAKFDMSRIG